MAAKRKNADWIKLDIGILTNTKLEFIRAEEKEDGLKIELLWILLLALAGECNNDGKLSLSDTIPFTISNIATKTHIDESIVEKGIAYFKKYGMIEEVDGFITIHDWYNHQNERYMSEKKKAYDRRYQQDRRDAKKLENTDTLATPEGNRNDNRNDNRQIYSVSVSSINNNNINNNIETVEDNNDTDFEAAWEGTFDKYPVKDKAVLAKAEWMRMLTSFEPSRRREMAMLIYKASRSFVNDYESSEKYEKNKYKYLKNFQRFLVEDCVYWIEKVEKHEKKLNGSS